MLLIVEADDRSGPYVFFSVWSDEYYFFEKC